jgi:hypothetical protein
MVVADGQGIPLACLASSASPAEVNLVEEAMEQTKPSRRPLTPLIADRAYDCDPLRGRLREQGWE